ncbi:hypothetical protein QFC21_004502 [Naganishia friedmannii]|uniref:Uncharacterized protein n=1 Tax=Naganishia friedmannii TaxID=89922 RepID=A0ACC2VGA9_9TREE|nr:hypothetical protein QFC21_004502 [Naganishia friedmannii]
MKAKYPYPSIRQQRARQRSHHSSSSDETALSVRRTEGVSSTDEGTPTTSTAIQREEILSTESISNALKGFDIPPTGTSEDLESQEFSRPRIDWKLLTKIDTNWATGTAGQYSLSPSPSPAPSASRRAHLQDTPTKRFQQDGSTVIHATQMGNSRNASDSQMQRQGERHLLALSSPFIFVAYPSSPLLHVHASNQSLPDTATSKDGPAPQNPPLALIPPPPGWSSLSRPDLITCIKVDSNDSAVSDGKHGHPVKIAVFYQSGGFVILCVKPQSVPASSLATQALPRITWSRVLVHKPSSGPSRSRRSVFHARAQGDPVVVAELHSPILVSCSRKFYISIWQLPEPAVAEPRAAESHPPSQVNEDAVLLKTLYSPVSFHPATLSLRGIVARNLEEENENDDWESAQVPRNQSPRYYRASLAYAVPLYPERWTLAIQDFDISLTGTCTANEPFGAVSGQVEVGDGFHVGRSSSSGSYRLPLRWPLRPTSEIVGVKGDSAIGIGLDENFAVLAGSDNQIQVYKLPQRSSSISHSSPSIAANGAVVDHPHDANSLRRELTHVQTLLAHSSAITAIALENGRCVSAGNDEKILVWNVDREANIVPADDGAGFELEEMEPADLLGGWTVVPTTGDQTSQRTDGAKWSHVEVRSRKQTSTTPNRPDAIRHLKDVHSEGTAQVSLLSSTGSLHQQILPMPPVTHPLSLASAARECLPIPRSRSDKNNTNDNEAYQVNGGNRVVEQLAFNEDRIVGLVRPKDEGVGERMISSNTEEGVIKVWTFDA